jgi:hypothetical protein
MAKERAALAAAAALPLLVLAACEDQTPPRHAPQAVEDKRGELPKWLTLKDDVDPAVWLATRESGPQAGEPAVARLGKALGEAGMFFLESPRMLANRSAQLGEMLSAAGMSEDYARLIVDLSRVAASSARKQTFGELCQHYFNLRRQGQGREAAFVALTERYALQNRDP